MPPETSADRHPCPALAWLPASALRRLTALEDGVNVVVNPHTCMLPTGHTGDHLALVQFAGEMGQWATWTIPAGPVSVEAAGLPVRARPRRQPLLPPSHRARRPPRPRNHLHGDGLGLYL